MKITHKFIFFYDGVFSNFYPARFEKDGLCYHTSEQYFMAEKARYFKDDFTLSEILNSSTPGEAKKLGRRVLGFDPNSWRQVSEEIMMDALRLKFSIPELKSYLLSSRYDDKIFVEASPYDKIWGVGLDISDPLILDSNNWEGLNLLGKCINKVRKELIDEN